MTACVQNQLAVTESLEEQLAATQSLMGRPPGGPKLNMPNTFFGMLGTVDAWVFRMDQYLAWTDPCQALAIAKTNFQGEEFSWYQSVTAASTIADWPSRRDALTHRFSPLKKEGAARDMAHKWRQAKDVTTYE